MTSLPLTKQSESSESEFERQKRLFKKLSSLYLAPHRGRYVVCRDGKIVDSDADLPTLTARFFGKHGHVPVYVSKIGDGGSDAMTTTIDTPFFD